jgi:nucleoside 2-deoxyribosyltransferase
VEVERFFRGVVDPVVAYLGYAKAEMGEVPAEEAFMNVEIFSRIHRSGLLVVDLTGVRPNCTMELGYAFGRLKQVVLMTAQGTKLPFDPAAIDTHMWSPTLDDSQRIEELKRYRARTAHRPPLVRPRGWRA